MKLNPYLNKFFFVLILSLILVCMSKLTTIESENKIKKITSKLRCMTCQNQTIYDSDAEFSKDIKIIVQKKLNNNETEKEIINFLIERYGEYIVFEPQMNKQNVFLWFFPFIILALCFVLLIFKIKNNN